MQSQGMKLYSNDTGWAGTWVEIVGLTKLPIPTKNRNTIDMTDLNSADNFEVHELSKLRRGDELEFEYNTNQARFEALDALVEKDAAQYCKITHPDSTKTWWFTGLFVSHNPGEGAVDAKIAGKFKIKLTAKPYFQTAAPT